MSQNVIDEYLSSFVNRVQDIPKLLNLIRDTTNSKVTLLFLRERNTNYCQCIGCTTEDDIEFNGAQPKILTIGEGEGIAGLSQDITTSVYIPLQTSCNYLGFLCLLNRKEGYTEEIVKGITPLISLAQLATKDLESEAAQAHDCKDLFMANMSHEIRTPLNGIIGYNQLLMQTKLDATQKNYLSSMRQCSIQLMQIINDILDFFKLSSGTMKEEIESFRVTEIIQAVNDALDQSLLSKKQIFNSKIDDRLPPFLVMDKRKLIQIVMNLVANAHKFTPIGGSIMLYIDYKAEDTLEIRVRDDGIGISKADQGKIFRAFEQVEGETSRIGTGLGLAICRKLSNFLGGDIRVQSALGDGSTFAFTAQFKPYEDFAREITKDVTLLKGRKILVVDDNVNNRILLSELLFSWEMDPVVCASGMEALRMVQAKRTDGTPRHVFEIGLIDICMQEMNGIELAKQIKQGLPLLPLIALSSVDSFNMTKDFESKLNKPLDKVQLLTHICRVVSHRENPKAFIGLEETKRPCHDASASVFNKDIRILIAEDIQYNCNLLVTMLESLGYLDIVTAKDGKDAIDKLSHAHESNHSFEIILLDLRMPNKNGYDVIQEHTRQGWTLPKIVVVTASIMDEDRQKCRDLGVRYFLNKPIELTQLQEVMLYVSAVL